MAWDPLDFVWPRLYAALQAVDADEDDSAADAADKAWETACTEYEQYLQSVAWPTPVQDFQKRCCLHDARLLDVWYDDQSLILTLRQAHGAWDARRYIAVLRYMLASPPQVDPDIKVGGPYSYWLYDQWADLGDGKYRHHILFDRGCLVVDLTDLQAELVFLSGVEHPSSS